MSRSNSRWHAPGSLGGSRSGSSESSLAAAVMRRVWLLETMQRVVSTIHQQDNVEDSLPEIARTIFEQFGMVSVGIGVLEDGWIHYRGVASTVSSLRNRVPVVPYDATQSDAFPQGHPVDSETSSVHGISDMDAIDRSAKVPIRVNGDVYGVLSVAVNIDSRLTGEELEVLEQIASVLGTAIAQSRRRNQQLSQAEHLTRLQGVLARIQDHIDSRETTDDVLRDIESIFSYSHVQLGTISGHMIQLHDSFRSAFRRMPAVNVLPASQGVEGRAARTGRPQLVRDVSQDSDYLAFDERTAALVCAPIWSADEVIGVLRIASDVPGGLNDADLEIAHTLTDRLGLVLGNLRSLDELERRSEQIQVLERISSTIGRAIPTQAAIADVVRDLQDVWGEASQIAMIDNDRLLFHCPDVTPASGMPDWMRHGLPLDAGITGRVVRSGVGEFVREVKADPDYIDSGMDTVSEIVVPIKVDRRVIGVVNVESTRDRELDDIDFETLNILGNQLGIALSSFSVFATEQNARKALEAVQRVSSIVAQTLDPEEALRLIAETLAAILRYPIVAMEVIDGDRLRLAASFGFAPGSHERQAVDSGVAGWVATEGEIQFIQTLNGDPYAKPLREGATSGIYVPIRTGTALTGVLTVQGTPDRELSEWDVSLLRTFAESAGVLLANTRVYDEMRSTATTDSITGIANHRFFQQRLRQLLAAARRDELDLSLLVIDIDSFKDLNDRFGHIEGDHILTEIAQRLNNQLRSEDMLARYAGDEFVVILPGVSMRVSLEIAARLLRAVRSRPFEMTNGETVVVTLSIGAATFPADGVDDEALISAADTAMYLAKGYGRDAVCHFRDVALLDHSNETPDSIVRINH